jgi:methionine-rich copper-binding protein CopC
MNKNKKSFDEKNDLITVRPKKIIEQVKTFHGESDFIVPRKNTYIDKKNNTIVSLARDNSHSSVDTVGEYANATNQPQTACPQFGFSASANNLNNTDYQVTIGGVTGGQAPYDYTIVVTNSGNSVSYQGQIGSAGNVGAAGTAIQKTGFATANGGVNGGTYSVLVTVTDANGCPANPQQWSGGFNLVGLVPSTGSGASGGGNPKGALGALTNYGTGAVANATQGQVNQGQQSNVNATNVITKNVPAVSIQTTNASSVALQPDTISVSPQYQDGQAPYIVDYTITDASGNVVVQKTNNTNSLQDSLQPSASGLSAGGYVVTVKVTGSDGSSDTKTENVNVKGKAVVQGKLKINNLNVTTTNPTTTGFDVNLTWADGTSPFQVNATITNGTNAVTHQMPENSNYHSWTQPLIVDASGNTLYGTYAVDVVVTDANGDSVAGNTSINIQAPKASPLAGQLVATNIQNASFDVSYKFANGVAPFSLTATLYYAPDASGNAQSFPITQSGLSNMGTFPIVITPDANGNVIEGYYKLVNSVVTDANGQTANLNDIAPYLNGQKGTTTSNVPTPTPTPTTTTTSTTTIVPMGGGSGGGGGAEEPTAPEVVAPKDKLGINWLLVIIALGVGYAIIRKKQ